MLLIFLLIPCVCAKIRIFIADSPIRQIGSILYNEELLTDKYADAKELAYDSSTRNLYFMYMDNVIQNSGRAFINVLTKRSRKINGIERNKATAVDSESGEVYFGSVNGLYVYDPIENEARSIGLFNINIFKLIIRRNNIYVVDAEEHSIYKVMNKGRIAVKIGDIKTVMELEVDFMNNIHYVTMDGLFCYSNGEIVKNKDLKEVYHFISDELKTFGVTGDGLYEIYCNGTAIKVANLDFFPKSIVFGDYGDIFYSVDDRIFRLKPVNKYTVYNIHKKP